MHSYCHVTKTSTCYQTRPQLPNPLFSINYGQTADDNEGKFDQEVTRTLRRNFYFDDNVKSVSTVSKTIWLVEQLTKLLAEGRFHLTKFISNSREVLASIHVADRANSSLNLDLDDLPIERVLGLHWDAESDIFQFKSMSIDKPYTKQGILSVVSSLYMILLEDWSSMG